MAMYTRAAIATAAGEPLAIDTVKLDGPREGEAMVEIMATGVATPMRTRSPAPIRKGSFRPSWGTKGLAWSWKWGRG